MKKKYLNTLSVFSKNERNDSTITCADTRKASVLLIRKIYILMQNLSPLPNDVFLTMKLFYYDEGSISILSRFLNCVQTLKTIQQNVLMGSLYGCWDLLNDVILHVSLSQDNF